jgi:predicted phosphodiesterase
MSVVGVIGDTHIPYELAEYREWCVGIFDWYGVDTVVHIGDLIDHHALSFHDAEPTLVGAHGEMLDARQRLKPWYKSFPDLTLVLGNHDNIPARQLSKLGMVPESWLRPLSEVYAFPPGWKTVDEIEIEGVTYHHGYTANGVNGFRTDSAKRMCRTVSGHCHSNAGISGSANSHRLVWGMAVGCGVDNSSMAFAYGKHFPLKPIIACGVVADGHPYVEYMPMGEH